MKILILHFLFSIFSIHCYSQVYYKAGDLLSGYVDISPDTLVGSSCPGVQGPSENFFFYLNNDSIPELKIQSRCSFALGGSSNYIMIEIYDTVNLYTLYGHTDSVFHTYFNSWMTADVAKPLFLGDTINPDEAYWTFNKLYLSLSFWSAGSGISVEDWLSDTITKYIGLKYYLNGDTIYGWIRVKQDGYQCRIMDYSMSSQLIKINILSLLTQRIYPNPASSVLIVDRNWSDDAILELFDLQGKRVMEQKTTGKLHLELNTATLPGGIYLLKIQSNDNYQVHKIIIQD